MRRVFDEAGSCEGPHGVHDIMESWGRVRDKLCSELGTDKFNSWISPLILEEVSNDCAILGAPREFQRFYVETHYGDHIRRLWADETKKVKQIKIRVRSLADKYSAMRGGARPVEVALPAEEAVTKGAPGAQNNKAPFQSQDNAVRRSTSLAAGGGAATGTGAVASPLQIGLEFNPAKRFDSFVMGEANKEAVITAMDFAKGLDTAANSLFVYGKVGTGKTHLLNAVGQLIRELFPERRVLYLSMERFTYHFVRAIKNSDTLPFKDALNNSDVLFLDDVQFLSNKKSTQEEFFYAVDNLLSAGKRVVCCADVPPSQLGGVSERIVARLGQGSVVGIQPPDLQLRRDILERKLKSVEKQGMGDFKCSDDLLDYLAQTLTSDVRVLEGGVYRIMSTLNAGQPVTVESVRTKIMADLLKSQPAFMTIAKIQKHTADYFGIQVEDLCSKRRTKDLVYARHIAMYLCKELTPRSYPQIAARFGGKDHSTIIHAVKKIAGLVPTDDGVRRHIAALRSDMGVH